MDPGKIRENLKRVRDEIAAIQAREGWSHPVRIVAVTKGHPPEVVRAAVEAGVEEIGENRVQEAMRKQEVLAQLPIRWHLIGHLQTNKAKYIPGRFEMVQSVDSQRVADALARAVRTRAAGGRLSVLLQVNLSGEPQKSGCLPDAAEELAHGIAAMEELRLEGLMTMAPLTDDEAVQRRVFGGLRELKSKLEKQGLDLPILSMGMSGDFRSAVAEGATMVRLGTLLLGERTA
ncbi:MAG: YggS family pyridoxal phosphate enzyme [Gemmatimonadales bacterium]|nr:MAG: YggS family pyridoxal phosphate enzyme [Gemmatimonadales bacterium]